MSENVTYNLKWKYFTSNATSRISDVFTKDSFCDVTLVSDDQKPFLAHRYVLSTFSPVLKDILHNNPHSHPLIYLRGVNYQELYSILQFIYIGKTSVYHNNIKKFAQVAKDLKIKKLAENIRIENSTQPEDDLDTNDDIPNNHYNQDDEEHNEYAGISVSNTADIIDIQDRDEFSSGKKLYRCEECEISFKGKSGLSQHTRNKHDGLAFYCKYCNYKSSDKSNLKRHQESKHEGVFYTCDQCDYQARDRMSVRAHNESIHEGVRYSCNQCEYQATQKRNLMNHEKISHEGQFYSCNQCNMQFTTQTMLKAHIQAIHEGVKYFCDQCEFQTGRKQALNRHKR